MAVVIYHMIYVLYMITELQTFTLNSRVHSFLLFVIGNFIWTQDSSLNNKFYLAWLLFQISLTVINGLCLYQNVRFEHLPNDDIAISLGLKFVAILNTNASSNETMKLIFSPELAGIIIASIEIKPSKRTVKIILLISCLPLRTFHLVVVLQ